MQEISYQVPEYSLHLFYLLDWEEYRLLKILRVQKIVHLFAKQQQNKTYFIICFNIKLALLLT